MSERPLRGYGVTWWEVLVIYLGGHAADATVSYLYGAAIERIVKACGKWRKNRRDQTESKSGRPLFVAIYDEEGNVLKALEFKDHADPIDVTEDEREKGKRPPPQSADD